MSYETAVGWENGLGNMTKIAAMPIYGKIIKKYFSLEPADWLPLNFVCSIKDTSTIKFI